MAATARCISRLHAAVLRSTALSALSARESISLLLKVTKYIGSNFKSNQYIGTDI